MHTSLRATTDTLTSLLTQRLSSDSALGVFFSGGGMTVTPKTPQEMSGSSQPEQGLSVWLYRVLRDEQTLNRPQQRIAYDLVEPKPLPMRLHYLMTPIVDDNQGNGPLTEQEILGKVLQTFHDTPMLRGSLLDDAFLDAEVELAVRLEPLGLEEITRVWDALETSYELCASYEVSIVPICTAKQPQPVTPVDSVLAEYGVIKS